jgi:hypothetical protein
MFFIVISGYSCWGQRLPLTGSRKQPQQRLKEELVEQGPQRMIHGMSPF